MSKLDERKKIYQERLDELKKHYSSKIIVNDLNPNEENIHNRGISAGYFALDVEDISDFSIKDKILYFDGIIKGIEKLKKFVNSKKEDKENSYLESRKSYLRVLGNWDAIGTIKVNISKLETIELRDFDEGVSTGVVKSKTLDDVFEELRRKRSKESFDDYLEERRNHKKHIR